MKLTAAFQKVPEGYIGFVEELEAISLLLEANRMLVEESRKDQEVIKEPLGLAAL